MLSVLEELVRKRAKQSGEREEMVVVLFLGPRDAEEGFPGDELKEEAAKAPDIESLVDGPSKN